MAQSQVNATVREGHGSAAARRYRRAGTVPAILNRLDRTSQLLSLNAHDFERMLAQHISENIIVTVSVDGAEVLAFLHEVQRDGLTGRVIHADFGEINRDKKMRVQVPIVVLGDPIGVTRDAGILEIGLHSVDLECLPADVVEDFTVDVSGLEIDGVIHVKDLGIDETKYMLLTHSDLTVASVRKAAAEAPAPAAPAEGDAAAPADAAPAAAPAAAAPAKKK